MIYLILAFGLGVVLIIWVYADPRPLRLRFTQKMFEIYLLLYFILIPQIISHLYLPLPKYFSDRYLVPFGIIVFTTGLVIDLWARFTLSIYWGPPGEYDKNRQTKLITTGPYRYSRNPIYIGTFLMLSGFSLTLSSVFFLLPLILFFYFYKQIKKEEEILAKVFKSKYLKYKQKVPRFFKL